MRLYAITLFLSNFFKAAAKFLPAPSDISIVPEQPIILAPIEPEIPDPLLEETYNRLREAIMHAQLPEVFPYRMVEFVVPTVLPRREIPSIFAGVQEIHQAILDNNTHFSYYSVRIQELLFERLMSLDTDVESGTLEEVDRSFRETYRVLYNRIFHNPPISDERRACILEMSQNIITSRTPLVELFRSRDFQPNRADVVALQTHLDNATSSGMDFFSHSPEERYLSDVFRGIDAIMVRALCRILVPGDSLVDILFPSPPSEEGNFDEH